MTRCAAPPSLLADRYELTDVLGSGGTARVWRAHDRVLDRWVAVKVTPAGDGPPGAGAYAEGRRHALVLDRHVVTVLDAGRSADGREHLVLELAAGGSLARRLAVRGVVAPAEAITLLREVAAGLGAVHRAGLVHRDVKPGNVLLHADGRALLADFGISLRAGEPAGSAAGEVVGTLPYLAPEQVRGGPATPAGDVYAVGVLGHELLTGRRSPGPLPTGVPGALRAVLTRALDDDPRGRFVDGDELAAALAAVPDPQADPVTRPLAVHPGPRSTPGRRWLAAAALTGCVLLGGGIAAAVPDPVAAAVDVAR